MKSRNMRALKLTALGLVGFHFLALVLHSVAHRVLPVEPTPAQLAFVIVVIIVAPLAAGLMLLKFERVGAWLLLASMVGSFVFGVYYHFVADTIDHVAHVARMQPVFWSQMFQVTSYLLAASEVAGALVAWALLKEDAARTSI
jgi:hypothetical protein